MKNIVDILNTNRSLDENRKTCAHEKRMLFHSYSGDNKDQDGISSDGVGRKLLDDGEMKDDLCQPKIEDHVFTSAETRKLSKNTDDEVKHVTELSEFEGVCFIYFLDFLAQLRLKISFSRI